jgi:putative salt-induced outer membrane protein
LHSADYTNDNARRFANVTGKGTMYKRTIISLAILISAVPAYAQEPESPWSGKVSFGYLATSGNTENSNLNTAFQVGYTPGQWAHLLKGLAIYATESNATTSEAYELGWKSERNITEQNFLVGRLDWRKDRFSTYEKQFSQTVGYGR